MYETASGLLTGADWPAAGVLSDMVEIAEELRQEGPDLSEEH
jgi:hypothetical protein